MLSLADLMKDVLKRLFITDITDRVNLKSVLIIDTS